MTEQVFSDDEGSPRLPSASFARVGHTTGRTRDLPAHWAVADHNGEPVCVCGWDPAQRGARSRYDALAKVHRHAEDAEIPLHERAQIAVAEAEATVLELERTAQELAELHPDGRAELRRQVKHWMESSL